MFTLVQKRLGSPGGILGAQRNVSEAVIAMIKTCVGAATTSMKILKILHEKGLIGWYSLSLPRAFTH